MRHEHDHIFGEDKCRIQLHNLVNAAVQVGFLHIIIGYGLVIRRKGTD